MLVDRKNRDHLIEVIDQYLDEEITAFEFDDRIMEICQATVDPTVEYVAHVLWFFYDDCKDHKAVLSKQAWNYFQRLVLLLKSDAHVEAVRKTTWSFTQLIAATALALFGLCTVRLGFGSHLLAVAMPFGVVSIMISGWRQHLQTKPTEHEIALMPFCSLEQLFEVGRSVHGFSKRKYPAGLETREVHSRMKWFAVTLQTYSVWLLFSPFVLLYQMLPISAGERRIVTT